MAAAFPSPSNRRCRVSRPRERPPPPSPATATAAVVCPVPGNGRRRLPHTWKPPHPPPPPRQPPPPPPSTPATGHTAGTAPRERALPPWISSPPPPRIHLAAASDSPRLHVRADSPLSSCCHTMSRELLQLRQYAST
nr:formin-like protein 14 [Lolium perenne]